MRTRVKLSHLSRSDEMAAVPPLPASPSESDSHEEFHDAEDGPVREAPQPARVVEVTEGEVVLISLNARHVRSTLPRPLSRRRRGTNFSQTQSECHHLSQYAQSELSLVAKV